MTYRPQRSPAPGRSPLSRRPWHMGTLLEALIVLGIIALWLIAFLSLAVAE